MKKYLIFILFFLFIGCDNTNTDTNTDTNSLPLEKVEQIESQPPPQTTTFLPQYIQIIEGCEYVVYNQSGIWLYIHKGNCSNCWARLEKLIKGLK